MALKLTLARPAHHSWIPKVDACPLAHLLPDRVSLSNTSAPCKEQTMPGRCEMWLDSSWPSGRRRQCNRFPHHLEKKEHYFLHQGWASRYRGHCGPKGWAQIRHSIVLCLVQLRTQPHVTLSQTPSEDPTCFTRWGGQGLGCHAGFWKVNAQRGHALCSQHTLPLRCVLWGKGSDFYPRIPETETRALKIHKDQYRGIEFKATWVSALTFLLNQGGPVIYQTQVQLRNICRVMYFTL